MTAKLAHPRPSRCLSITLLSFLIATSVAKAQVPRSEFDAENRLVRDANGRKITYSKSESLPTRDTKTRVSSSGFATLAAPTIVEEWHRGVFGSGIGAAGLHAADLDLDGQLEIVASHAEGGFGEPMGWYLLAWDGATYEPTWFSPFDGRRIGALEIGHLNPRLGPNVLVARDHEISIYELVSGRPSAIKTLSIPGAGTIRALAIGDINGDGSQEIAAVDDVDLWVLDPKLGTVLYRGFALGGTGLALGNVDADPALEIVTARGEAPGRVIDGVTKFVEWSFPGGFGFVVRTADIDRDGRDEIVGGALWTDGVSAYDADTRTRKWNVPVLNLGALRIADLGHDGRLEVLYGNAQWGSIHVLRGGSGEEKWAVGNPEHGTTDITVGDTDGDGVEEVLWGAGHTSSGPDRLYAASTATHLTEWASVDLSGPFLGFDFGDIDGDGGPEILSSSDTSNSGYSDGLWFVHDARTHRLEYQSPPPTGFHVAGTVRLKSANIDSDPQREVFVSTSWGYDGRLIAYDGLTHAEMWREPFPSGLTIYSLALGDLEGDGRPDLVVGTGSEHSGAPGVVVYVFDATNGAPRWRSPTLPAALFANLTQLRIAQLDNDPQQEVAVASLAGELWVLDPTLQAVQLAAGNLNITALDTPDRDNDKHSELIIGRNDGRVDRIDPTSGAVLESILSVVPRVDALSIGDHNGDRKADYLLAVNDQLRWFDGTTTTEAWQSSPLGRGVGAWDSLWVDDIDGDGKLEIVVNVGPEGFSIFEIRP